MTEPSRYLIFLTPRLDRLIARLQSLSDRSELRAILAEFDTVLVGIERMEGQRPSDEKRAQRT